MFTLRNEDIVETPLVDHDCQENEQRSSAMDTVVLDMPDTTDTFNTQVQNENPGSSQDMNSVEGSYVSLLADIATIEKNDEMQNSQADNFGPSASSQIIYTPSQFVDDEEMQTLDVTNIPVTMSNEDFIAYHNLTYSLTNATENSAESGQHFVIVHPMQELFTTQSGTDTDNLISATDDDITQMELDSQKEFEDAVANIQNDLENDKLGESSLLVRTNNQGYVDRIKIIPKNVGTTERIASSESPAKRRAVKKDKDALKEYHSSTSLKKFSLEELNSDKSKSEILSEYLRKAKTESSRNSKDNQVSNKSCNSVRVNASTDSDTNIPEAKRELPPSLNDSQESQVESQEKVMTNLSDNESLEKEKSSNVVDDVLKPQDTTANKSRASDQTLEDLTDTNKAFAEKLKAAHQLKPKGCNTEVKPKVTKGVLTRTSERVAQKRQNSTLNHCNVINKVYKKSKFAGKKDIISNKHDSPSNYYDSESKHVDDDDAEERLGDICKVIEEMDKFIVRISPITLKTVCKKCVEIELGIFDNLIVSDVEKEQLSEGQIKYKFLISKPVEDLASDNSISQKNIIQVTRSKRQPRFTKSTEKTNKKLTLPHKLFSVSDEPCQNLEFEKNINGSEIKDSEEHKTTCNIEPSSDLEMPADIGMADNTNTNSDIPISETQLENNVVITKPYLDDIGDTNQNDELESAKCETSAVQNKETEAVKEGCRRKGKTKKTKPYTVRIDEEGNRRFDCPTCGYTSKYSQNVVSHMLIHQGTREWVCEDCGLAFINNNQLQKHRVVHQKDRPLSCPLCEKTFKGNQTLKQHLKRHLGMKNYMCEHCSRGFVTKGDLNKHTRKHTGSFPYQCNLCEKKFNDISAMYRHSNSVHKSVKQYRCKFCQQTFTKLDSARSHVTKCHGNLIDSMEEENGADLFLEDLLLQGNEPLSAVSDSNNTFVMTISEPSII